MLTRCPNCIRPIIVMGGTRAICPKCAAKFDVSAATQGLREDVPERVPVSSARADGREPVPVRVPATPARANVPRGKPGDHRPVDRRVCAFCRGRGMSFGRTCSRCRGYGYERSPLEQVNVQSHEPSTPVKQPLDSAGMRSSNSTEPALSPRLSPESKMTWAIVAEAEQLVAAGWRPFEVTPGRLFLSGDIWKTKKVTFEVWSAIYRIKAVGIAQAERPRTKTRSK